MSIRVDTKHAYYIVDREKGRWCRVSETYPRGDDGEWINGGFTLAEVGGRAFAHFSHKPNGGTGRWTSPITSITEEPSD